MAELVKDLVCEMEIDPETAAATSELNGTTYYFCAVGCKQDFDADPQKYIGSDPEKESIKRETEAANRASAEIDNVVADANAKRWWEFWKS